MKIKLKLIMPIQLFNFSIMVILLLMVMKLTSLLMMIIIKLNCLQSVEQESRMHNYYNLVLELLDIKKNGFMPPTKNYIKV